MDVISEYSLWKRLVKDDELCSELEAMTKEEIEDAFYRTLAFGTGGLRGVLGAGTNRMNVYTVGKATQGLANYLLSLFENPSVAISYDSRINSKLFAETCCSVLAANGIKSFIYSELMPTPCLSYAVRALSCNAGIMITASHNPSEYNGYKVYGSDGCQITDEAAAMITEAIEAIDIFNDVAIMKFHHAIENGSVEVIPSHVLAGYYADVLRLSVTYGDSVDKDLRIVYTPLNGTGLVPVTYILNEVGFSSVFLVEEQKDPDGLFPTCKKPNPEEPSAMVLGLEYASRLKADLILATDPDCDRCGVVVRDGDSFKALSGNEVGLLLLDYICSQRLRHNQMPDNPVSIKTIVTSKLAEEIAAFYGAECRSVLTGFKYIGELIGQIEATGDAESFIFGFEESCGYLSGIHVRDKDAVDAVMMICEMAGVYKSRGYSLCDRLNDLYSQFGYCLETLHSYEFPGKEGVRRIASVMNYFRSGVSYIGDKPLKQTIDYLEGINGLPKTNMIQMFMEGATVVMRPSGTEPKLKVYLSVLSFDKDDAIVVEEEVCRCIESVIFTQALVN